MRTPIPAADLPDGLRLRGVTPDDTEPLAVFQSEQMHRPMGFHVREWLRGDHPTADPDGFTLVEKADGGGIVSAACLLPQTFAYEGVPVPGGRAEAVATRPDYRRRGLVRAQFEALHRRADATGQLLQIVEGATWLYRDFGYAPVLDNYGGMNSGARTVARHALPPAPASGEPFTLRPAGPDDLSFVRDLFARSRGRYGLSVVESEPVWAFLLRGGEPGYNRWYELGIVSDAVSGERAGFVVHDPWGCGRIFLYELREGVSWLAATPAVLRGLCAAFDRGAATYGGEFDTLGLCLAPGHPVFAVAAHYLTPGYDRHAIFGVRIADPVRLLRRVAPALTRRLAASACAGHTADLRLNFVRAGVRLSLTGGVVAAVEGWTPAHEGDGDARFVGHGFTALLLGARSPDEVSAADRDCAAFTGDAAALLSALFPRRPAHVGPLA